MYSGYMEVEKDWMRDLIRGKIIFRKCPDCDKDGRQYWDENGENCQPSPKEEWGENYGEGPCETCDGLGYLESLQE